MAVYAGSPAMAAGGGRFASGGMRSVGVAGGGLDGLVSLKGGLKRVVIRQLKALGIVGFPIPKYDAQTCTWQPQKTSASG